VQVLAAYTEGARRGRAVVLLPTAEVVQVLQDSAGLTASGQAGKTTLLNVPERHLSSLATTKQRYSSACCTTLSRLRR
jgi:hypothetical protein